MTNSYAMELGGSLWIWAACVAIGWYCSFTYLDGGAAIWAAVATPFVALFPASILGGCPCE